MILIVKNAKIKRSGSDLIVSWDNYTKQVSTLDLELLVIVGGNVELSSGVINFLSSLNIPVLIHGKKVDTILVTPFINTISEIRRKFYSLDEGSQLLLAKRFIEGKIRGMLNVAKYFSYIDKLEVNEFEVRLKARDKKSLILEEAELSKRAWEELKRFIPNFQGRKPRAEDPINRAIDYAYSLIYTLSAHALIAAGLDPYAGLLHVDQPGRPSLVYDFSEMFKPVAVHTVIAVSRRSKLSLDSEGYLNKDGVELVTKHLYGVLYKRRGKRRTIRGEFYKKANDLKKFVLEAVDFQPFVYKPQGG